MLTLRTLWTATALTLVLAPAPFVNAQVPQPNASASPASRDRIAAMDAQMKAMREMHDRMVRARTPQERNALMAEQMKLMQDGMAAMGGMGPGGMQGMQGMQGMGGMPSDMASRQLMLDKRMDMMQSMMQMMIDRIDAAPSK